MTAEREHEQAFERLLTQTAELDGSGLVNIHQRQFRGMEKGATRITPDNQVFQERLDELARYVTSKIQAPSVSYEGTLESP